MIIQTVSRMKLITRITFGILCISILLSGCKSKPTIKPAPNYTKPIPTGQLALRKITDPSKIPDFTAGCYDLAALQESIDHSLSYMSKPSSDLFYPYGNITHRHLVNSLNAFSDLLEQRLSPVQLNRAIRQQFDVYESIGWDNKGTVLFTGYYTPIFNGAMQASSRFRYPIYKKPQDLIKEANGTIRGRQMVDGSFTPYASRQDLVQSGELVGKELLWLEDPFEVYITHVQGSAKIRLPNGELITIGYTANNGHAYHSIAKDLIREKVIPANKLSLASLIQYFKANPQLITVMGPLYL